ncbi:MAG: FISUMP domain-containing protein [Candidatus Saccharimonadaceae bacterium]|nr:FISUMP domain-containing protein [Candidatus Saccharimonadaceae bacterium]
MTTIPIEVIVQDETSPVEPTPTPTPTDPSDPGKNTNITVPETGAGIVDSNNGNSMSSPATIIVSIVIAILAISTVIALLIRKYNKRNKANIEAGITRQERRAMVATGTIAVLALTVLLGQLVVAGVVSPIATNAATDDTVNNETELDVDSKITIIATRTEDEDTTVATVKNTSTATSHQTFGYKVTASMAADATTANLYLDGDETSEYYIAPVSNEENGSLEANTWGYTTEEESEDYLPIPLATNPITIAKGANNIDDEPVDIYYTIQVDKDLPAGTYTGTIEYTLTDNNFPSTLTIMQGMTTEICEDTFTPGNQVTDPVPTATLRDIRDDKTYTIAKLADGNCWMTQNLDLDLDSNTTLTPEDTNISVNWTPERNTIAPDDLSTDTWQYDQVRPYSYNPGDVYYYTSGTDANDIQYNSLAECEAAGHTDCSHYHAGNYYNWPVAVASNNTSDLIEQYTVANTSVCPKGWRLPAGPESESEASGEMYAMLANYSEIVEEGQYKAIRAKPFWLVRTGRVYYGGSVDEATRTGFYWTSTVQASGYSYELTFHGNIRYPDYENKMAGLSIRCVAR